MEKSEVIGTVEHTEQIQEIITDVPNWIIRWGISIFFLILFSFFLLASLISMPDIIRGTAVLERQKLPDEVIIGKSGNLTKLFVKENSVVDSGDVVGLMQSTANHYDVLNLGSQLDSIHKIVTQSNFESFNLPEISVSRHLGELQSSYQEFINNYIGFEAFLSGGVSGRKRRSLKTEIENVIQNSEYLKEQLMIQKMDYELATKNLEAFEKLYKKKMISPTEYRAEQSKLIKAKFLIESAKSAVSSNTLLYEDLNRNLMELDNQIEEKRKTFLTTINRFKSEIEIWKRDYLLIAHKNGKVIFTSQVSEGKRIVSDSPVFYIDGNNSFSDEPFIGKLRLNQTDIGKIREGQKVVLKLRAYPYQEFGVLYADIEYFSELSLSDTLFYAKINLVDNGVSSYGKKLFLRSGMAAEAEIITRKRSLLSKLFDSVYSVYKNRY